MTNVWLKVFLIVIWKVDFCEHCIYGKQNRVKFPPGDTREKKDSRVDT
jgi:hypothetical protein